jgi:hypothetical protein
MILDSAENHGQRVSTLKKYCGKFSELTTPLAEDCEFMDLVDSLISRLSGAGSWHINVLEDYYELQQDKVRALLGYLKLNIHLVTVSFNVATHTERLRGLTTNNRVPLASRYQAEQC